MGASPLLKKATIQAKLATWRNGAKQLTQKENHKRQEKTGDLYGRDFRLIPEDCGGSRRNRKSQQKRKRRKYRFRGIDDVMTAFQPALANTAFSSCRKSAQFTDRSKSRNGGTLIYTTLTVAYTFCAGRIELSRAVVVGAAMDPADKSSNKRQMSAALKYALLQTFCVPVESQTMRTRITPELAEANGDIKKPQTAPRREKLIAEVKVLEVVDAEGKEQLKTFDVDRVSALNDKTAVWRILSPGWEVCPIKAGRTRK